MGLEILPKRSEYSTRMGVGDAGHRISQESRLRMEDASHYLSLGLTPILDLSDDERQRISVQVAKDLGIDTRQFEPNKSQV